MISWIIAPLICSYVVALLLRAYNTLKGRRVLKTGRLAHVAASFESCRIRKMLLVLRAH